MKTSVKLILSASVAAGVCIAAMLMMRGEESNASYVAERCNPTFTFQVKTRSSIYIDVLPHNLGFYLGSGKTTVNVSPAGAKEVRFTANEELVPFSVYQDGDTIYLVLMTEYIPERGFIAYSSTDGAPFRERPLSSVPEDVLYPNFGPRFTKLSVLLRDSAEPPPDFYETNTARLWSQFRTGKPALAYGTDLKVVDDEWKKWRAKIGK